MILPAKRRCQLLLCILVFNSCGVRGRPQPPAEPAYIYNKQNKPVQDRDDKTKANVPEQSP